MEKKMKRDSKAYTQNVRPRLYTFIIVCFFYGGGGGRVIKKIIKKSSPFPARYNHWSECLSWIPKKGIYNIAGDF